MGKSNKTMNRPSVNKNARQIGRQYDIAGFYNPSGVDPELVGQYVELVPKIGKTGCHIFVNAWHGEHESNTIALSNYASLGDIPFEAGKWYSVQLTGERKSEGGNAYFTFEVYEIPAPEGFSNELPF